ncbi:MAG: TadE/TadG family type IV pilus assembly protein [Chlamydiota bacterium]
MRAKTGLVRRTARCVTAVWHCDQGNELVEFAVTLPIIAVLLIGILDFGMAINRKQELNNAAREGARWAVQEGTIDLTQTTPPSILSVRDVIVNYLNNAHVNTCGLASAAPTNSGQGSWTFTANTGCPGTLTLVIDRGGQVTVGGMLVGVTHVSLQYPYAWHFGRAITLIAPGAKFPSLSQLSSDAYMPQLGG